MSNNKCYYLFLSSSCGVSVGFGTKSNVCNTFVLKSISENFDELDLNAVSNISSVHGSKFINTIVSENNSKETML